MTGYTGEAFGFEFRDVDGFIEGMNRHSGESFISISRLSANISPTVSITAPAGTPVAQDEVIRVDTSDEKPSAVQVLQISIEFDNGLKETVYDSVYGFGPGYQGAANTTTDISTDELDAVRVEFNRDAGWADSGATVRAISVDIDGNVTDESEDFTFDVAVTTIATTAPGGTPVGATEVVRVDTTRTDPGLVTRVEIDIEFDNGLREVVWDGDDFGPGYQGVSNQQTSITDGFRTEFNRDAGWPDADGTVHVVVVDEQGVVEEDDQALTFDVAGDSVTTITCDDDPVTNTSIIEVEATRASPGSVSRVIVDVEFTGDIREVVWDGDDFGPAYQGAGNQQTNITGGIRIEFDRDDDWPAATGTVHVTVVDNDGNVTEASEDFDFDFTPPDPPTSNPPSVTFNPPDVPAATDEVMSIDAVDGDSEIKLIIILVSLPLSGIQELAYMSIEGEETFGPRYQGGENTTEPITNGTRVNLLRTGGWPEKAVEFLVTVTDDVL